MKRTALSLLVVLGVALPAFATAPSGTSGLSHGSFQANTKNPAFQLKQPKTTMPLSTALPVTVGLYPSGLTPLSYRPTGITQQRRTGSSYAKPHFVQPAGQRGGMIHPPPVSYVERPVISGQSTARVAMWRAIFGGIQ